MLKNKNTLKLLRWGGKLKLKDKKKDKKKNNLLISVFFLI